MRILILCNKPPYPPKDGGSLAMYSMIMGLLNDGHQVKVIAVNAPKYGVKQSDIPDDLLKSTGLELINADLSIKPLPALLCLLQRKSYQLKRFYNKTFANRLRQILQEEQFDIVQFETVFPTVYLDVVKKNSTAKTVLRAHNIENLIWKQLADNQSPGIKKWYLRKVAESLKKYELELFTIVEGITPITYIDTAYIELKTCKTPVKNIPFGIDISKYLLNPELETSPTIFHLAAMNWMPNEEGIKWFLEKVWPEVLLKKPNIKLILAGKNMPEWIKSLQSEQLIVAGEVPDSWIFFQQNGIMIVPLFSGSGVRIKIIEGMLAGKPIISTTKGASGIKITHDENILIADNPEDFAKAIFHCIENPAKAEQLGKNARDFILKNHNISNIIPELIEFYKELQD